MVALVALALRVDLSVEQRIAWTGHGWFPLSLAALEPGHARAYPSRVCVHTSLAFLTWSVVAAIVPSLTSVCFVGLAGIIAGTRSPADRATRPAPRAGALRPAGRDRRGLCPRRPRLGIGCVWARGEPGDRGRGRGDELDDAGSRSDRAGTHRQSTGGRCWRRSG